MGKGYAEGPAAEEAERRREEVAAGDEVAPAATRLAVEGSSAMMRSARCSSAIAIATRWRMPPENWCG